MKKLTKNNFQQLVEKINDIHVAMQRGAAYAVNLIYLQIQPTVEFDTFSQK
ncbi:MAG: hypothetical protein LBN37_00780 [Bacteroidales bacterium]|jgi:hypothetical protein|nr:hypothetical protein [Bacteroidales bacterium]